MSKLSGICTFSIYICTVWKTSGGNKELEDATNLLLDFLPLKTVDTTIRPEVAGSNARNAGDPLLFTRRFQQFHSNLLLLPNMSCKYVVVNKRSSAHKTAQVLPVHLCKLFGRGFHQVQHLCTRWGFLTTSHERSMASSPAIPNAFAHPVHRSIGSLSRSSN